MPLSEERNREGSDFVGVVRIRAFSKEKAYGYGARKPTGIIEPLKRRNEQDPRMTDNSPFVLQIQTADSVRNSSAVP